MAHELFDNKMFYVGQTPWHGLGTQLDVPPSTEEALQLSNLDWKVHKGETFIKLINTGMVFRNKVMHNTGYCCTYRFEKDENGNQEVVILGHVSKKYEVLQNKDAFQPFDQVLLDSGYKYETAGAVKNGQQVWILAKAPESRMIGDDQVDDYILLFNSHNGSTGVTMKPTMIRVVCNNTLEYALNIETDKGISLRHTTGVKDRLDSLTEALRVCEGSIVKASHIMSRMAESEINKEVIDKYFEEVFPTLKKRNDEAFHPVTGRKIPNFAKPHYDKLVHNFYYGVGNKGRTMWDAYNAVTEYVDHDKNYTDPMSSIGFGWGKDVKQRAFKVARNYL